MIHIRLEPEASVSGEKKFYVTQPGSSVATSLSEGEAKEKAVGILEIKRKSFKINPVSTVLPFYKMLRPQKDGTKPLSHLILRFRFAASVRWCSRRSCWMRPTPTWAGTTRGRCRRRLRGISR